MRRDCRRDCRRDYRDCHRHYRDCRRHYVTAADTAVTATDTDVTPGAERISAAGGSGERRRALARASGDTRTMAGSEDKL